MEPVRKQQYKEALEPILGPGDVVLVVCNDDSHTLLYGQDYRTAYAQGQWSPRYTVWSVLLGFKILGELIGEHMKVVFPGENLDPMTMELTQEQLEVLQKSLASGSLMPNETFPLVAAGFRQLAQALEGHLASCAPNEYRQMQENMKKPIEKPMGGERSGN